MGDVMGTPMGHDMKAHASRCASTQPSSLRNINITPATIYQKRCCPRCIWTVCSVSGQPLRSSPGATCKRLILFFSSVALMAVIQKAVRQMSLRPLSKRLVSCMLFMAVKYSLVSGERKCIGFKSH